jgi:hypothetical protein
MHLHIEALSALEAVHAPFSPRNCHSRLPESNLQHERSKSDLLVAALLKSQGFAEEHALGVLLLSAVAFCHQNLDCYNVSIIYRFVDYAERPLSDFAHHLQFMS